MPPHNDNSGRLAELCDTVAHGVLANGGSGEQCTTGASVDSSQRQQTLVTARNPNAGPSITPVPIITSVTAIAARHSVVTRSSATAETVIVLGVPTALPTAIAPGPFTSSRDNVPSYWHSNPDVYTDPCAFDAMGLGTTYQAGGMFDALSDSDTLITSAHVKATFWDLPDAAVMAA